MGDVGATSLFDLGSSGEATVGSASNAMDIFCSVMGCSADAYEAPAVDVSDSLFATLG